MINPQTLRSYRITRACAVLATAVLVVVGGGLMVRYTFFGRSVEDELEIVFALCGGFGLLMWAFVHVLAAMGIFVEERSGCILLAIVCGLQASLQILFLIFAFYSLWIFLLLGIYTLFLICTVAAAITAFVCMNQKARAPTGFAVVQKSMESE